MTETREEKLRVIWLAMLSAAAMYLVVAVVMLATREGEAPVPIPPALRPLLILGSLGLGLLALLLGRHWLRPATLAAGRSRPEEVWARYQTALILCWAIDDGIAVVGLVVAILSGDAWDAVPFVVVAVVLAATLHRPSTDVLEEARRSAARHAGTGGSSPRG